jgi:hypothetical protein
MYLSRIQLWSRFHFQIQWPLYFAFHVYWFKKDVMVYPDTNTNHLTIKNMFTISAGFKRDSDCTWLTAAIGGRFE